MTEVTNPNIKTTISNHHVRTLPEYETFEQKNTLFSLLVRKRCIHLLKTRWCTMVL